MEADDLERVHWLDAHPMSVGAARKVVGDVLSVADREDLVETAQLVVSELVTNAVIHAGTSIQLRAQFGDTGLRVEVRDGSQRVPTDRHYGALAATGRGLRLVDQLADRWGTVAHRHGKTVWFEMAAATETERDPSPEVATATRPAADVPGPDALEVVLLDAPLLLLAAWREHAEALLREHFLMDLQGDDVSQAVERHAMASNVLSLLHAQIPAPAVHGDPRELMALAVEPGVSSERVVLAIPRHTVQHFDVLDRTLDAARVLADTGALLTPPIQPEMRALRRWLCGEVRRQHDGEPPTAWAHDPYAAPPPERPPIVWDATVVTQSSRALIAADDTDQIVALSEPACRLLGYQDPSQLVRRRLIAIIPPRYHQAHLAGFTLHLSNGRAPLLGRPVLVPVLRRDGTETHVELEVQSHRLPDGRLLFIADMRRAGGSTPATSRADPL